MLCNANFPNQKKKKVGAAWRRGREKQTPKRKSQEKKKTGSLNVFLKATLDETEG